MCNIHNNCNNTKRVTLKIIMKSRLPFNYVGNLPITNTEWITISSLGYNNKWQFQSLVAPPPGKISVGAHERSC